MGTTGDWCCSTQNPQSPNSGQGGAFAGAVYPTPVALHVSARSARPVDFSSGETPGAMAPKTIAASARHASPTSHRRASVMALEVPSVRCAQGMPRIAASAMTIAPTSGQAARCGGVSGAATAWFDRISLVLSCDVVPRGARASDPCSARRSGTRPQQWARSVRSRCSRMVRTPTDLPQCDKVTHPAVSGRRQAPITLTGRPVGRMPMARACARCAAVPTPCSGICASAAVPIRARQPSGPSPAERAMECEPRIAFARDGSNGGVTIQDAPCHRRPTPRCALLPRATPAYSRPGSRARHGAPRVKTGAAPRQRQETGGIGHVRLDAGSHQA